MDVSVRPADEHDCAAVAAIYASSVETTAASFELVAPDAVEMSRRWLKVVEAGCPFLVAQAPDGVIVGYAYARPFHERAAFAWTVEDAIYVAPGSERRGVGRVLLGALVDAAARAGFRQMIALISSGAGPASERLHAGLGFARVGRITAVGFKNGEWHDIVYMQRELGAGATTCPE
ncbi:MAG: N-acetyltransferase [Hyphomicrobiaceae bacterium]|nr:N-acetyltransferase [Hyphomicrobiaceae bacterium]